jgi:hypothetical protein
MPPYVSMTWYLGGSANLPLYISYCATDLCWAFADFSVSWSYSQPVGFFGRGINPSQGLYLHTEQHKHKIYAHNTDIHAWIRNHDKSVRANEESSWTWPRGYCDRHLCTLCRVNTTLICEIHHLGKQCPKIFFWLSGSLAESSFRLHTLLLSKVNFNFNDQRLKIVPLSSKRNIHVYIKHFRKQNNMNFTNTKLR